MKVPRLFLCLSFYSGDQVLVTIFQSFSVFFVMRSNAFIITVQEGRSDDEICKIAVHSTGVFQPSERRSKDLISGSCGGLQADPRKRSTHQFPLQRFSLQSEDHLPRDRFACVGAVFPIPLSNRPVVPVAKKMCLESFSWLNLVQANRSSFFDHGQSELFFLFE